MEKLHFNLPNKIKLHGFKSNKLYILISYTLKLQGFKYNYSKIFLALVSSLYSLIQFTKHGLILPGSSSKAPEKDHSLTGNSEDRIFGMFNAIAIIATTYGNGIIPEIQVWNSSILLSTFFIYLNVIQWLRRRYGATLWMPSYTKVFKVLTIKLFLGYRQRLHHQWRGRCSRDYVFVIQ